MIIYDDCISIRHARPSAPQNAMELTYTRNCCTTSRNPTWFEVSVADLVSRFRFPIFFPCAALKFRDRNFPQFSSSGKTVSPVSCLRKMKMNEQERKMKMNGQKSSLS